MPTKYKLVGIDAAIKITMDRIRSLERSERMERMIRVNAKIRGNNNE